MFQLVQEGRTLYIQVRRNNISFIMYTLVPCEYFKSRETNMCCSFFQAMNCVEEKEWMDLLTKVCQYNTHRLKQYHPGAYINSNWLW